MGKKYEIAPIIEAICEMQFEADPTWDLTVLGLVYEKLKDTFPIRNQIDQINAVVARNSGAIQADTVPLMQFAQENKNILIQVGQNLLTINHLRPYTSWENFQPQIYTGLKAYAEVENIRKLSRVALRYINRITLPAQSRLEEYFHFRPFFEHTFLQNLQSFLVGVQIPSTDARGTVNIQLGTTDTEDPDTMDILLNITYELVQLEEIQVENILEQVNQAHKNIEEIFEACITDILRQEFREIE